MSADRVTIEDIPVMCASEKGAPGEAGPRAFARLERALPPKGRRFYGYWDPRTAEYHACVALKDGDDPAALGLHRDVIRGGPYLRERLRGAPSEIYPSIAPTFDRMQAAAGTTDASRHFIESYRREDEVDLLVPIPD